MPLLPQDPQTTPEGEESTVTDLASEKGLVPKTLEEVQVRCNNLLASPLTLLIQAKLAEADELKLEGNDMFRLNKWDDALQSYRNGLALLPERKKLPVPTAPDEKNNSPPAADEGSPTHTEADIEESLASGTSVASDSSSPLERECAKARSVLNANIAACYVKLVRAHADYITEDN